MARRPFTPQIAPNSDYAPRELIGCEVGHGNVGRSLVIPPGRKLTVADLNCDDPNARTFVVGVTVDPFRPRRDHEEFDEDAPRLLARPTVVVEWSSGGTSATAEIDVLQSLQFTLAGSSVRVSARNPPVPRCILGHRVIGRSVKMGAWVAYGTTQRASLLKFTEHADEGFGDGFVVRVPEFATNYSVLRHPADALVTAELRNEARIRTSTQVFPPPTVPPSIPFGFSPQVELPDGTNSIKFIGPDTEIAQVIFGLAI